MDQRSLYIQDRPHLLANKVIQDSTTVDNPLSAILPLVHHLSINSPSAAHQLLLLPILLHISSSSAILRPHHLLHLHLINNPLAILQPILRLFNSPSAILPLMSRQINNPSAVHQQHHRLINSHLAILPQTHYLINNPSAVHLQLLLRILLLISNSSAILLLHHLLHLHLINNPLAIPPLIPRLINNLSFQRPLQILQRIHLL